MGSLERQPVRPPAEDRPQSSEDNADCSEYSGDAPIRMKPGVVGLDAVPISSSASET